MARAVGYLVPSLALVLLGVVSPSPASTNDKCNHEATIVEADYPRNFSPDFEGPLAATVLVVVGADGSVEKASISKSSGDLAFNMASIRAAKASKYSPKVVDCKAVEAAVPFETTITPAWARGGTPSPRPR